MLEHYLRDENFAGVKMQPLFDAFTADSPMVDPIMEIAEAYKKPVFIHCGHPPYSLPWQIGLLAERHPHVPTVMIHMGHGHGVYIEGQPVSGSIRNADGMSDQKCLRDRGKRARHVRYRFPVPSSECRDSACLFLWIKRCTAGRCIL